MLRNLHYRVEGAVGGAGTVGGRDGRRGPRRIGSHTSAGLRQAQAIVVDGSTVFLGPDADLLGLPYRSSEGGQYFQFNAQGLKTLGGWSAAIAYDLCRRR